MRLTRAHNISGVPVVDGKRLVGIVTSRDLRFERKLDDPVRNIMTRQESWSRCRKAPAGRRAALLHKHRIEKVLVVNDAFELRGLITVKDIQKARDNPHAAKDSRRRLLRRRSSRCRWRYRTARGRPGRGRRRRAGGRYRARSFARSDRSRRLGQEELSADAR